jgi:transcriptional regulator with XRE-family HTH domain
MLTHKQLRAKALGRADVKTEFDEQSGEYALLDEFLKARADQGLTQAQVAERIGTTQSAVARMESGKGRHSPSLATLTRYAEALGCSLEVRLVRKRGKAAVVADRSRAAQARALKRASTPRPSQPH